MHSCPEAASMYMVEHSSLAIKVSICFVGKPVKEIRKWRSDCVPIKLEPAAGVENTQRHAAEYTGDSGA